MNSPQQASPAPGGESFVAVADESLRRGLHSLERLDLPIVRTGIPALLGAYVVGCCIVAAASIVAQALTQRPAGCRRRRNRGR